MSVGDIGFSTYSAYIRAAGGWILTVFIIVLYFVTSGSLAFSDWWLSVWIDSTRSLVSMCNFETRNLEIAHDLDISVSRLFYSL